MWGRSALPARSTWKFIRQEADMHVKYQKTVDDIVLWAQGDPNVTGVVLLGSQVRETMPGDEWSDLDALVFARDAAVLTGDPAWLGRFGSIVVTAKETVDLSFAGLVWHVSRAIYEDGRVVDISVIPYGKLDTALEINREIHANGYKVVYDEQGDMLRAKIEASLKDYAEEPEGIPAKEQLDGIVNDLLFHVVWVNRKLMRGEVWTAARCVDRYMNDLLLRLVEHYNRAFSKKGGGIRYEGRFLEARTDAALLRELEDCMCAYRARDARAASLRILELVRSLSKDLYGRLGYPLDEGRFGAVRILFTHMHGKNDD
jgi:hypothetical protein